MERSRYYDLHVIGELTVIGENPENADVTNPYGHIFGELYTIELTLDNGMRFVHANRFYDHTIDDAFMFLAEAKEYFKNNTNINLDVWTEVQAVYGSDAYIRDNWEERMRCVEQQSC